MTAAVTEGPRGPAEGPGAGPWRESGEGPGAGPWPEPAEGPGAGPRQDPGGCVPIPCGYAQEYEPEFAPFLGPYLGLVAGVLCALVGAFLLLAPFAFDYRQGAAAEPRSTVLDLATGGALLALGLLTAGLFGVALVRRVRVPAFAGPIQAAPDAASGLAGLFADAADTDHDPDRSRPETSPGRIPQPSPEPAPVPEPAPAPAAPDPDPSGALRDLLTPLVAALAADLRAREQGGSGTERDKDRQE
jgi:hypothetical protein